MSEARRRSITARVNSIASAAVIAAALLLPPAIYGPVSYSYLTADTRADARVVAEVLEQVIAREPQSWATDPTLLRHEIGQHSHLYNAGAGERVVVRDREERPLVSVGEAVKGLSVTGTAPFFAADRLAGHVTIERSLRALAIDTALVSLLGLVFAAAGFVSLRVIPLRQAARAYETLRQSDKALAFANSVLTAATEGSPDAILIVDKDARIVSYNQHFIDLWNVPEALVEAGTDEPVLALVAAQARDTDAFAARVSFLYEHRQDASNDRIDLEDGRIIDRYTKTLFGQDRSYLGRIWFFRDVTERERAAEALKQSELRFRAIFDNARDGIALTDAETRKFLIGNTRLCQMLGCTAEEFATFSLSDIHPAESMPFVLAEFERHDHDSKRLATDIPMRRRDGSVFFADISSAPVDLGGRRYVVGIFRDATERKEAEGAVRKSEEKYRNLVESTSDYIWEIDRDNRYTYYSPTGEALLGYAAGELIGKTPFDIMAPREAERVEKVFAKIAAAHRPFSIIENTVLRKDGSEVVMETSGVPIFDHDGAFCGYRGIERDVTDRKRGEAALQESQQFITAILNSVPARIFWKDRNLVYLGCNETFARDAGFSRPDEIVGKDDYQMGWRDQADLYRGADREVIETGSAKLLINEPQTTPEGKVITLLTSKTPLRNVNGEIIGVLGTYMDVTERAKLEEQLQRRDTLLHGVAITATELITASSLDDAVPKALKLVGDTLQVDRVNVLDRGSTAEAAPILRFSWHSPELDFQPDNLVFEKPNFMTPEILAWQAPVLEGKFVTADVSTATGDLKRILEQMKVKSLLVVSVSVNGKYWGQLGLEDCKSERAWPAYEIEILQLLADLIGNAIQRDRYVREIADANRIVQNTPTILFRIRGEPAMPMIYISQNIRLFGYEPAVMITSPFLYKDLIHPADMPAVREAMAQVIDNNGVGGVTEFRLLTSRGTYRWFENRFTAIRDDAGRLLEIEGLLFDVTERKAAEERIALLARTDSLTGLANRSTFIERLRQSFAAARRGAPIFAVLYLDIDRFKDINDTLGHPVGDHLLTAIAGRFMHCVRETDVVARFGGDEFSILQNDVVDSADAGALAAKVRAALAEPVEINGNELRITASVGISVYGPETAAPEDLLAQADLALYRAKEEGRDQFRFHTEELDIQVREEVALAEDLRHAIARDELKIYYQPQVELDSGRIVGMEALIRWQHPKRGLLPPAAFIPIAERTGTILAIGQWVLDQACEQMRRWRDAGIAPQTIAVNISAAQVKTGNEFIQFVTDALAKSRLAPADLELDVTESMLARAAFTQNDVLERLREIGVQISIDDFGTKYSTLDYLRTYRVNRLKIPQALTEAASRDPESAAMVRAIVGIARELNIEVIAQGVETEAQWAYLTRAAPVKRVQGYYFSEPVPAGTADQLLARGRIATFVH